MMSFKFSSVMTYKALEVAKNFAPCSFSATLKENSARYAGIASVAMSVFLYIIYAILCISNIVAIIIISLIELIVISIICKSKFVRKSQSAI